MKKIFKIIGIGLVVIVGIGIITTIFADSDGEESTVAADGIVEDSTADDEQADEDESEPEVSNIVTVSEEFEFGDWSITVNSFETTESVSDGIMNFTPSDDGNLYLVVDMTVTNNGTSSQEFIPMFGGNRDMSVRVYYNEDFVYSPSTLLGHSDDISSLSSISALASRTGILAYSIPPIALDSDNSLDLIFNMDSEDRVLSLR